MKKKQNDNSNKPGNDIMFANSMENNQLPNNMKNNQAFSNQQPFDAEYLNNIFKNIDLNRNYIRGLEQKNSIFI